MELSPEEQAIYQELTAYQADKDFIFNPDEKVVERIVKGLAARERKTGNRYCPCRLAGADEAANQKIICPCAYHQEEIKKDGRCHCDLFVAPLKNN